VPKNTKTFDSSDRTKAITALNQAAAAIASAQSTIPAAPSELPLDDVDCTYQKLNDAKSDIQSAQNALGGKPCGGGKPC
jgi:hypothetical protein